MAENQLSKEQIEQQMAERLGTTVPEKKEEKVIEEKKPEVKAETTETKVEEKKPEVIAEEKKPETTEDETVIKIAAKAPEQKAEEKLTTEEDDIDEEKLLKALSKKSGKEIKSLDDFLNPKKELTEEDKQKAKEKRDADKIAFALAKGLVTEKKLSKYFADAKNKKDLVFEEYWQTQSAEDKTLTKAQAELEFRERFNLDAEEDSRQYKKGIKEIDALGTQILHNEYPEIFELERTYSAHETSLTSAQQQQAKIIEQAPLYKKDVVSAFDEIKSIKVKRDGEEFEIQLDKSLLDPLMAKMLDKDYAEKKILAGWNKEDIKAMAQGSLMIENFNEMVFSVVDKAVLRKEMGLKGVKPEKNFTEQKGNGNLSVKEKAEAEIKERLQGTPQKTAAAN